MYQHHGKLERAMKMIIQTKIQKWGNGLALRVAGAMRDIPGFQDGTPVEVTVTDNGLNITRTKRQRRLKLPFSEEQLLADLSPKKAHADILATPVAHEIDPP